MQPQAIGGITQKVTSRVLRAVPRLPSQFHAAAVSSGKLFPDPSQSSILPLLDTIVKELPLYDEAMHAHATVLSALESQRRLAVTKERQRQASNSLFHRLNRMTNGFAMSIPADALPNSYYRLPEAPIAPIPPRGLYLYGDVGCGKSLLMDILFTCSKNCVKSSARVHYHAFMSSVYSMIHRYDSMSDAQREQIGAFHPLDAVVGQLGRANAAASGGGLLCFDEFQVADVADARLMHGIFERLMKSGTIVCFTANRQPEHVNRSQLRDKDFIPFLDLIHERCQLVHVNNGIDYRERIMNEERQDENDKNANNNTIDDTLTSNSTTTTYTTTNSKQNHSSSLSRKQYYLKPNDESSLHDIWCSITGTSSWNDVKSITLDIAHGRQWHLSRAAITQGTGIQLSVSELIESAVGANDYRALCDSFKHIFISDILPIFSNDTRNFARRFITLIDVCYETKTRLIMRMAAPNLDAMFDQVDVSAFATEVAEGLQFEGEVGKKGVGADNRSMANQSTLYSGEDEIFAFKRAVSRLKEMQTKSFGKRGLF